MTQAGAAVKEEVVRALIVLISNAPELHGYAVRAFYRALAAHLDRADFALVMAATWLIGGICLHPFADILMLQWLCAGQKHPVSWSIPLIGFHCGV